MANINIKNGEGGITVVGGEDQTVGSPFKVQIRVNNRELVEDFLNPDNRCQFVQDDGRELKGHPYSMTVRMVGNDGVVFEETEDGLCAPLEDPKWPDPLIEWELPAPEPGDYDIEAIVEPHKGPANSADVSIQVQEVGSSGDASGDQDRDRDGDGSLNLGLPVDPTGGNGGGGGGSGQYRLLSTAIQNPIGAGIILVGGTVAIRQLLSGDD